MKILILINPLIMNDFWAFITINSYYRILLNNITQDVVIDNNDNINKYLKKNYIIITFSFNIYKIINTLKQERVILINVDNYTHFKFQSSLNIITAIFKKSIVFSNKNIGFLYFYINYFIL